ncbi:MAG: gamma-glutamyltransferase family protein [Chloroflexi bacterium]|nr:gamma-glutamyltransferase family protein [Chloroflexota bacterium]
MPLQDADPSRRAPAWIPAAPALGTRGAVASPHALATGAGMAILRAGGSAVDAAIATNAVLAVVAGHSCGLGGDAFWLIHDPADGTVHALNGSGRSAAGATIEAARTVGHTTMPERGPWTVTVPGAIDSWAQAHARFGRLPWADLLAPAIELATDGFPADPGWVGAIDRGADLFGTNGDWAHAYRPNGRTPRPGERIRLPALGATLRVLAGEGASVSYTGRLAARAATYLADRGSPLRATDLAAHRSDWGSPIATTYRGVTSLSHPPNSSGAVALTTLAMLDALEAPAPDAFDGQGVADARWVHLGIEASRLALADRDRWLTDLDAMEPGSLDRMLDRARARERAQTIDPDRAAPPIASELPPGGGTIYLCTADAAGGAVSLIESNYAGFGSGLVDPETGIGYQNRGAFFRLDPDHANSLAPSRRTMHTLTPGMLLRDGRPWVVHGSMGGEIQPQVFAQVVSALVDGGVDVATAVAAPRWATTSVSIGGAPVLVSVESRYRADVIDGLRARGHDPHVIAPLAASMGHAHAIEIDTDGDDRWLAAAADPRSEGQAQAW